MKFKENKSQQKAIETIDGPVMLISCPGSGKTTTLIRRIHYMIEKGIEPSSILMVTFSRAAALEMRDKYEKFFGKNPGISFQTIHSLCFNLLLRENKFSKSDVLQEEDKNDYLVGLIRTYPNADGDLWDLAKTVAANITSIKNNYEEADGFVPDGCDPKMFKEVYRKYEAWKTDIGKIDFDDMLIRCKEMFDNEPAILKRWQNHFQYIQCDEYQDTNMIQRDILYALAGDRQNLCVVGDDDQSIYRFRGARPEIMLRFTTDFPNSKRILMGTNYRCAGEIVKYSGKLIAKNKIRYAKNFESSRGNEGINGYTEYVRKANKGEEMEFLVKKVKELHDKEHLEYNQIAVLFRTNQQGTLPVTAFSAAGIPFYAVERIKCIYDGWIFKDIKTYIDLACGNYSDSADMKKKILSILNKPNRYLNPDDFSDADFSMSGFRKALYPLSKGLYWKYEQALDQVTTWMRLMGPGKITMDDSPSIVFERLFRGKSIRYDRHMTDMAKFRRQDPDDLFEEYEELKADAENYDTIRNWLEHAEKMSRFIKEKSMKKDPEGVVLATMHRSKGLEWKAVFVIDCNDGTVPHKNSVDTDGGVEEERRLLYVAMTRAKDILYVINSNRNESPFIRETGLMTAEQRRLLEEIPKYLPGKKIRHKSFGEGKLVSYGPNMIVVEFPKRGQKTFKFPESFKNGFLEYL